MPKYANKSCTTTAGRQRSVYEGRSEATRSGGLTKKNLTKSKTGKIVSKKKSVAAKRNKDGMSALSMWRRALASACAEKGVSYQIPRKGTALYKAAMKHYRR